MSEQKQKKTKKKTSKKKTTKAKPTDLIVVDGYQTKAVMISEKDPIKYVLRLVDKYDIDPMNKEVLFYVDKKGNISHYWCKAGINKMRNRQYISTSVKIEKMKGAKPFLVMVKCTATKKDFKTGNELNSAEAFGMCESSERGKEGKPLGQILAMAETRSENRAIIKLLDLSGCSVDEMSSQDLGEMKQFNTENIDWDEVNEDIEELPKGVKEQFEGVK